ncbi:hypothetical protein ACIBK9_47275 [Nonomuraea sp. NPDC050227]|uniref:hypothetical protein n=1 Tax=Nonomuraea sp. NPDC050227 TaxID=3364360 RepID=UPI00378BF928
MSNELTPNEREVLADVFGDDPTYKEQEREYVVVSYWRGKGRLSAHGPYPQHLAEKKAKAEGGIVAERVKTTTWGPWSLASPDSSSEEG